MKKIRVFIADADTAHIAGVRRAISGCSGMEMIGATSDGRAAMELIAAFHPDVVLTDIQLPSLDGISLLRQCRRMRLPPVCIVCTRFYSDLSVEYACRNGAAFFLYKPIDPRRLPTVIQECWRELKPDSHRLENEERSRDICDAARELLREIGIPSRLNGSRYILEAVQCLRSDRFLLNNMRNGLYQRVSERTNATPAQIERDMRNAIAIAFERGSLGRLFDARPSNRSFLTRLLRRIDELDVAGRTVSMANHLQ